MENMQDTFLKELADIQEITVDTMLCEANKYSDLYGMLLDTSYNIIYGIMELIDGYKNRNICYDIIERKTGKVVNESIDLHNLCEDYIKCTKV